jgi:microcin C transport system substrate-binding protein
VSGAGSRVTRRRALAGAAGLGAVALAPARLFAEAKPGGTDGHAAALHGQPKYGPDARHFDTVNPKAPKGGAFYSSASGTFDTFNPYGIKGSPAEPPGLVATLMVESTDEPFTAYGYVAERIAFPADRSAVTFTLRREAAFHDGAPIAADDVAFTFDLLRSKGRPIYRNYYADVAMAEIVGPREVRFVAKPGVNNRELPLILGQLPVFSRAFWSKHDFEATLNAPQLGSGPYKPGAMALGRFIEADRIKGHWSETLPAFVGTNNFDRLRVDYFRSTTIQREALKGGEFDYFYESSAHNWATAYDVPSVRDKLLVRRPIRHSRPAGMQGFVFNLRRKLFRDWRLRRALAHAFDFEWANRNIFHGQYTHQRSYFGNSELEAKGLPEGEELKLLERYRGQVPDAVFAEAYDVPRYDGSGDIRPGLRRAFALLAEAGYKIDAMRLIDPETKRPVAFELLLDDTTFERIALPYKRNLARLGVNLVVRTVDASQYTERTRRFDYDMIVANWGASRSPGNEQRDNFGSAAADSPDSSNFSGLKSKAVDDLIERLVVADTREELVTHVRALDRLLQHQHLVVPHWYLSNDRVLYWDKFGMPPDNAYAGVDTNAWWYDSDKAQRLKARANVKSLA